jgi:hypothetical protein
MYVCMHVCMHVCMYACMYLCIYVSMYLCIYASVYVFMHVSMHVCIYVCVYLCMCLCIYGYVYVCMYVYACMYLCMCVCVHVCVCVCARAGTHTQSWRTQTKLLSLRSFHLPGAAVVLLAIFENRSLLEGIEIVADSRVDGESGESPLRVAEGSAGRSLRAYDRATRAGYFQAKPGQIECISCDLLGETMYQDGAGRSSCLRCPNNTQRHIGVLTAANLSACRCSKGYWRHDGLLGKPCYPCPSGSVCPGKADLPFPQQEYWAASEMQLNSTSRSLTIVDPPGVDPPNLALASIFFPCNAGRCKGGPKFECEMGYTGPLCFECQPNRFFWMGTCTTACDEIEPRALVTIVGMMTVVFVWYIFYMMTSGS